MKNFIIGEVFTGTLQVSNPKAGQIFWLLGGIAHSNGSRHRCEHFARSDPSFSGAPKIFPNFSQVNL